MRIEWQWLIVCLITVITMEYFGAKVGIAIIVAELFMMMWEYNNDKSLRS